MKIGIYARVSTDKQTVKNQLKQLQHYVNNRDWDLVNIYSDVITGKTFQRLDLLKLKKHIKEGKIEGVLVWDLTRLGRSVRDLIDLVEYFRVHGCAFISYHDNIDVTTPAGQMTFTIFAAIAEFQGKMISVNTKAAYDRKSAHAKALGQKVRWGRKVKNISDDDLIVATELVRLKLSWRTIATVINEDKDEKEKVSYSTLRRLFQNGGPEIGSIITSKT